ncbi:TraB/GumN family protein [Phenylobacterium sp.]|uniref:TraB/GumN family protein n=1 Tax=Phenylobacterium sp. TaxID=1871053 RepID=UPI002F3F9D3E
MLIALSLALLAGPAPAQVPLVPAQPDPADPDATLVEELVVTARLPGPAWWRVSKGDSVVYVLGAPGLAPKRMQWDRGVFERRLEGANVVILPFKGLKVKLTGAPGALIAYLRLKSSTPFEETLPPDLRARFAAVRERLGEPAKHYGTRNPLAAGVMLISDYREKSELTDAEPTKLVRYLAQLKKLPVEQKAYDLAPLLGAISRTPKSGGMTCLEEVLAEAEAGSAATRAAAQAWAVGDVRGALAGERSYERCLNAAPGALAFDARAKADQAAAIAGALQKPGHSIAVVQLRPLLSQGGVLDRLRAQGFEVKTPGEE